MSPFIGNDLKLTSYTFVTITSCHDPCDWSVLEFVGLECTLSSRISCSIRSKATSMKTLSPRHKAFEVISDFNKTVSLQDVYHEVFKSRSCGLWRRAALR